MYYSQLNIFMLQDEYRNFSFRLDSIKYIAAINSRPIYMASFDMKNNG